MSVTTCLLQQGSHDTIGTGHNRWQQLLQERQQAGQGISCCHALQWEYVGWPAGGQSYVAACTPEQCMGTAHLPAGVEQRPPLSLRVPGAAEVACRSLQSDAWPPSAVQQAPQPLLARCSGCRHLHAAQGCGCLALLRSQSQRLSLCFALLAASCQLHRSMASMWVETSAAPEQLQCSTQGSACHAPAFKARAPMLQPCRRGSRPQDAPLALGCPARPQELLLCLTPIWQGKPLNPAGWGLPARRAVFVAWADLMLQGSHRCSPWLKTITSSQAGGLPAQELGSS